MAGRASRCSVCGCCTAAASTTAARSVLCGRRKFDRDAEAAAPPVYVAALVV